jgi:hypothetical protein
MQSPFSVAVFAPVEQPGLWDLARDHYGSNTPMTAHSSAGAVVRAVSEQESTVGLLPMPQAGEPYPWWPLLVRLTKPAPRVIARLPFAGRGNSRNDGADALTIGFGPRQRTGLDRTLLAIECEQEIGRARILESLSAAGLVCTLFAASSLEGIVNLIEIEGFVSITDPCLDGLRAGPTGALNRLSPMGGYAVPLSATALAPRG